MRRLQILGVLGLAACGSDSGIKVFNSPPEASIISHDDGDEVKEARGALPWNGLDPDHGKTDLEASWQVDSEVICDWAPLLEEGETECTIPITTMFTGVTLLVRDPKDAVGSMDVTLKLQEDNDPQAEITAPVADPSDEDGIPFFWGDESVELEGLVWDEEDEQDALTVEWTTDTEEDLSMTPPDSTGATRASGYLSEGNHTITLTVTDSAGNFTSDTLDVQVGPLNPANAPDVTITSPEVLVGERRFYYGDEAIEIEGLVTDNEDAGDALSITWSSDTDGEARHHESGQRRDHRASTHSSLRGCTPSRSRRRTLTGRWEATPSTLRWGPTTPRPTVNWSRRRTARAVSWETSWSLAALLRIPTSLWIRSPSSGRTERTPSAPASPPAQATSRWR